MPVDRSILDDNAAQTRRLVVLVGRLSDTDLGRDLGEGWTVATALAHAAFWDRRAGRVFERWRRDGTPYRDQDDDILNLSLLDEWNALVPRKAADLAVRAAQSVDAAVAALPESVIKALIEGGNDFLLHRARHRKEHVDQIEAALR